METLDARLEQHDPSKYRLWRPVTADHYRATPEEILAILSPQFNTRVADTNIGSPIMADRLAPELIPTFVKNFPLYDLIKKVPSNGVSHTFEQWTNFTTATAPHTIAETGTVTDDTNTYLRKTTNIAVFAERRGVTLKAMFAGRAAGGPSADLAAKEIAGGLITIAHDAQWEMLQYQDSDPTSTTATAANGVYDVNGFNGLRYQAQNMSPPENTAFVDVRSAWTDQRVLMSFRQVASAIWDKGGEVDLAICNTTAANALFRDQLALVRYIKEAETMDLTPGLRVKAVETDQGLLPVLPVPGNQIGTWTDGYATYTDIYIVWTEKLELPYLGAPEPTIISVPIGTDGQLRELKIPYLMIGFANTTPIYLGRVSLVLSGTPPADLPLVT